MILNQGIRLEHLLGRFGFTPFITGDWMQAPGSQGPGISPRQHSTKPGPGPCHPTRRVPGISEWGFFHYEKKACFQQSLTQKQTCRMCAVCQEIYSEQDTPEAQLPTNKSLLILNVVQQKLTQHGKAMILQFCKKNKKFSENFNIINFVNIVNFSSRLSFHTEQNCPSPTNTNLKIKHALYASE